jgi:hypothetical protein
VPPDDIVNRERLESIGWIQLALACANKLPRRALRRHAGVQTRVRALSTQDQAALQPAAGAMEVGVCRDAGEDRGDRRPLELLSRQPARSVSPCVTAAG